MRTFAKILGLVIVSAIIFCQIGTSQDMIDAEGNLFSKRQGKYQRPKMVIDTVRMASGNGVLPLNKYFGNNQFRSAPTSENTIFPVVTQILDSLTAPVYSYGTMINDTGDTLFVVSSNSGDNSKVVVTAIIK